MPDLLAFVLPDLTYTFSRVIRRKKVANLYFIGLVSKRNPWVRRHWSFLLFFRPTLPAQAFQYCHILGDRSSMSSTEEDEA